MDGKQTKNQFKIKTTPPQDFEKWKAIFDEEEEQDPTEEERAKGSPFTDDDVEDEYTYALGVSVDEAPAVVPISTPQPPPPSKKAPKASVAKPKTVDRATSDDDIIDLVIKELSGNEEHKKQKTAKKPVARKLSFGETEEEEEQEGAKPKSRQHRTGAKVPRELLAAAAAHVAKAVKPKAQEESKPSAPAAAAAAAAAKPKKRDLESKEEEPKKKISKKEAVVQTDELCFPVFNIQPKRLSFVVYMCDCCSIQESICTPSGKQVITITVCPTCVMKNNQINAYM